MTIKGLYVGEIEYLYAKSALLRRGEGGRWMAQFDSLLLTPWCYGWHEFGKDDFKNIVDYDDPNDPSANKPCDPYGRN